MTIKTVSRAGAILATVLLARTAVAAQETAEPAADLKALADTCAAHKFETTVIVEGNRGKKVKICGQPGQSDAEWLVTLKDSAKKVQADKAMTESVKSQILSALNAEIEQLEVGAALETKSPVATIALPATPLVVPEAAPQYSSVPALPAPKPRKAAGAKAAAAPIVRPKLTVRCALPHESFAACARLERGTLLMVRADEDLSGGTSLRFLRGGDDRAELELGPMRKGEALRERLPGRVCAGVLRGKVEVQILTKNQVAGTLGPYALYCGS